MKIGIIAFTERGAALAGSIRAALVQEGDAAGVAKGFGEGKISLAAWTKEQFTASDALIFVGATGIAVRAVAPHLQSKAVDPAVVSVDEGGSWVVPLVSGHIGGANDLARRIAGLIGAEAIVTTATDVNGLWAVDSWAVKQELAVANIGSIKKVSGSLLAGKEVLLASEFPISGNPPSQVRFVQVEPGTEFPDDAYASVSVRTSAPGLRLVPRALAVGIGCRKGTPFERIDAACNEFLKLHEFDGRSLAQVASIDLKEHEPGIVAFSEHRGILFKTFSADVLNAVAGDFAPSAFVSSVTGTDNVCERSVVASGGKVLVHKEVHDGITFSAGVLPVELTFSS